MQSLEVSGAVRPIYGSLGVKRLTKCVRKYLERVWRSGESTPAYTDISRTVGLSSRHPPDLAAPHFFLYLKLTFKLKLKI